MKSEFEIGDWVTFKPEHYDYEEKHTGTTGQVYIAGEPLVQRDAGGVDLTRADGQAIHKGTRLVEDWGAYCYRLQPHFMTLVKRAAKRGEKKQHGKRKLSAA